MARQPTPRKDASAAAAAPAWPLRGLALRAALALAALGLLGGAALWLARSPVFAFDIVSIDGELVHNSAVGVRAAALPGLDGNFFAVDLDEARAAFESVPWVRRAVVRRVWPDRLAVTLEEHRAVALWQGEGADGGERLVNSHGELFDADDAPEGLPVFRGPADGVPQMLALHDRLAPLLRDVGGAVAELRLSGRGSWRARLAGGLVVELGRGSADEVVARCESFVRTVGQVSARWPQPLLYADLRHTGGYALKLKGVTTGTATN